MNFLIIGDVVGKSGMDVIKNNIENIVQKENIQFIIVNGENATGGRGLKEKEYSDLKRCGADVITMGNHIYYRKEAKELYINKSTLLIPANVDNIDGHGLCISKKNGSTIAVINLIGKVNMGEVNQDNITDPFKEADRQVALAKESGADYIFIDFHAETTAEKRAMAYYLENKITCLFGTHTHVQTSDEEIFQGSSLAYITDVGMTGPKGSVLGLKKEIAIERFLTEQKIKYECSENEGMFRSIIVQTDDNTKKAMCIKRYNI